ncbi:hypothetical protein DSM3645_25227 [Blastopirellula marina DSM 3645]|uniref:Uncharacterized protein n=1 Tax=Blastopirellula marina DSM 3645 TaxID=314230 RepID=A4A0B3_9BACT|nr:hypothetical protein DSM3645_25227 [Blastopirellula marina DSM 3645]
MTDDRKIIHIEKLSKVEVVYVG